MLFSKIFFSSLLQKTVKCWLGEFRLDNPFSQSTRMCNQEQEWNHSHNRAHQVSNNGLLVSLCQHVYIVYIHDISPSCKIYTITNAASNAVLWYFALGVCAMYSLYIYMCVFIYVDYCNVVFRIVCPYKFYK